ncbi:MAG TPA: hypothetical protein VGQ23_00680 [Burkholderiaceae bacterium]|nr:hypothetical protein [Burkholderiaceae bacterium]
MRAAARFIFALLLAPCIALAQPAKPLGAMLGLQVKFAQGQPLTDLPSLEELGVRWVRDVVPWPEIEPTAGRYVAFSPKLKQRLTYYRQHDIGVVALLTLSNPTAYPATASNPARSFDPAAFGRYAASVAQMLRNEGVRFVIELGNEPHNSGLAKRLGGQWNGKPPSPWVDHYVRMVQAGVNAVKTFDPSIRLLSDDDMWVVHYWFLEAGLPRNLDGFAVHPYTPGIPERAAIAADTDWVRPFTAVDPDRSFTSAVRRLRDQGTAKFARTPEIWITEWGWPVGTASRSVSEDTLAAYLPRAYIVAAAAGVEVLCWFSAQDTLDGPMGLTDNNGKRRPAYQAYRTLARQLGDQALLRQVAGASTPTAGVQAYLFQGKSRRTLVLWNADAATKWLPVPASDAVDVTGHALAAENAPSGRRGLRFGAAPIYVPGGWSDAEVAAAVNGIE